MSIPSLDDGQALYLYALTRETPVALDEPGIEERPIHRLQSGPFGAVVSVVAREDWEGEAADHLDELSWVAPRAYRHEEVVEAVMQQAGPVYPARFGTLFSTRDRLRETVDTHHDALRSYFDAIAGAEEWAVKGLLDRETAKAHLADEPASAAESGTAYLQRRKQMQEASTAVEEWLDRVADALFEPLATHATETRTLPVQGNAGREAEVAFNWAFLVPQGQAEAFRSAVAQQDQEHAAEGLSLDLTGPWPPYNFRPSLGMGTQDE